MRLLIFFLLVGCASGSKSESQPVVNQELQVLRDEIESWAKPCEFGEVEYPCERTGDSTNEDHATLWAGLTCFAEDSFCDAPLKAQSQDGKVWRSPAQIGNKLKNSSSRDMYLGFLLATLVTQNQDAAWRSYQYIRSHDSKLCTDADDNRCDMRPEQYRAIWGLMKHIWNAIGLRPTPTMEDAAKGDNETLLAQAVGAPKGYQLHLVGINLHVRKKLGKWNNVNQRTAETLIKKDPDNAYFEWLAHGATTRAVQIVLDRCPKDRPNDPKDWIWSQGGSSMGFDCLFMINLLTQDFTLISEDRLLDPNHSMTEISGIKFDSGITWAHNDSGNPSEIFGIKDNQILRTIKVDAKNKDWEDIAEGDCTGSKSKCIFIGDIGNNDRDRKDLAILEIPVSDAKKVKPKVWPFTYPSNESYNSEALAYDSSSKNFYIITKGENEMFRLSLNSGSSVEIEKVCDWNVPGNVTAFDISLDGKKALIRTYSHVLESNDWRKCSGISFKMKHKEPQGEAITYTPEGFMTISEGSNPRIYQFRRNREGCV